MKRKLLAVSVAAILLAITAQGTLSYFSSAKQMHNVITTGNVELELIETQELSPGVEVPFPSSGISGAMPGDRISKIVRVKNTGSGAAWVRIKLDYRLESGGTELPNLLPGGESAVIADTLPGWVQDAAGYYYWDRALPSGAETQPLFRTVELNPEMNNLYQGAEITLTVKVYGVQSANNGETVWDAAGWPDET